jgi:hypothetical protein
MNKKIIDYDVAQGGTMDNLKDIVKYRILNLGWQPLGGFYRDPNTLWHYQAMVKYEDD